MCKKVEDWMQKTLLTYIKLALNIMTNPSEILKNSWYKTLPVNVNK